MESAHFEFPPKSAREIELGKFSQILAKSMPKSNEKNSQSQCPNGDDDAWVLGNQVPTVVNQGERGCPAHDEAVVSTNHPMCSEKETSDELL